MKCRECEYCKMQRRANIKFAGHGHGGYGRGEFYCEHPESHNLPLKSFGIKAPRFIDFGTCEKDTVVQIKTSPRWCPLRRMNKCCRK